MIKKYPAIDLKVIILLIIALVVMGCSAAAAPESAKNQAQPAAQAQPAKEDAAAAKPKFKILYIMSYHSPWEWTDGQFNGFKAALKDVEVEYKIFQMDAKNNSSKEWLEQKAQEAKALIESWQPDLIYTSDDEAQQYVAQAYVNTDIPFVFSAVNADPAKYGFVGSKNITGVLEHQHFIESVRLLKQLDPEIKEIAVVMDDSPFWQGVSQAMREEESQLPEDVSIVRWDVIPTYAEYQQKVAEYQTTVDAIALLGVFNFKDESGQNVPFQEVLKWTAENSQLPDFSYWEDRISHGTLSSVTVSSYAQGLAAGEIARGILVDGKSPASFEMKPTIKGEPIINLARAKKLGLKIDSEILLTAKVIDTFSWED
jgi:ABC-type uncharacterized transport system substrate-binding protein